MIDKPLVSVSVLTFNSGKYVIETLESIKNQGYRNLELIVTDDCSTDDTVVLCNRWINENKGRFVRCLVVTSTVNTGISANQNRGIKECHGDWIKNIAGDDLLMPDCIENNLIYVEEHPEANVVLSLSQTFQVNSNGEKIKGALFPSPEGPVSVFSRSDAREQYMQLLKGNMLSAPTAFWKGDFLKQHLYNEIYKYEDDYEMWVTLTKQGLRIDYCPQITVMYRVSNSISRRSNKTFFSRNYMHTRSLHFWTELFQDYKEENLIEPYQEYRKRMLIYELGEAFTRNKRNIPNAVLLRIMSFFVRKFARYEL